MNTKIIVKGMHCAACETLVRMELEEAGLADTVLGITLTSDNTGIVELADVSDEDIDLIKSTINNMDTYSID